MEMQVAAIEVANPSNIDVKISSMTPRNLMKTARKVEEQWARSTFEFGALLLRIKQGIKSKDKNFKYNVWEDYVAAELSVGRATADNCIRVYKTIYNAQIPFEKLASLSFAKLIGAISFLSAENVDVMVPILENSTPQEIAEMPEAKAAKNPAKVKGGAASAAAKKTVKAKPAPTTDYAALAETITEDDLVTLFKGISASVIVAAFKASGKKGYKMVKYGEKA